jgi:hypothetical protein
LPVCDAVSVAEFAEPVFVNANDVGVTTTGAAVATGVGVALATGVGVTTGVGVAVAVGVALGVATGDAVTIGVGVAVALGIGVLGVELAEHDAQKPAARPSAMAR